MIRGLATRCPVRRSQSACVSVSELFPMQLGSSLGPWEPGAIWIAHFGDASVSQSKRQEQIFFRSFGVPSSWCLWTVCSVHVCVHVYTRMHTHTNTHAFLFYLLLPYVSIFSDKTFYKYPSHPTLPLLSPLPESSLPATSRDFPGKCAVSSAL